MPTLADNFDAMTAGLAPSGGWAGFASNAGFTVTASASDSSPNSVTFATAAITDKGWLAAPVVLGNDQDISADILAQTSLTGVMARASATGGSTLTAYGLEVQSTGGPTLVLSSYVAGVRTPLPGGTITRKSGTFISANATWLTLRLRVIGTQVKASLYNASKGEYFYEDGSWGKVAKWAINLTDSSIVGGSSAGLLRSASTTTTSYWDNFSVADIAGGDGTAPTVSVTAPASGATLTGTTTLTCTVSGDTVQVVYLVDGATVLRSDTAPFSVDLDPTIVDNGARTVSAWAFDAEGNRGISSGVPVTVSIDRTVSLPSLTSKKSWMGGEHGWIGSGTAVATSNNALWVDRLTNWYDSAIVDPGELAAVQATGATVLLGLYNNISNLIGTGYNLQSTGLLDWHEYADVHGYDRERAFLHAGTAYTDAVSGWQSAATSERLWGVTSYDGVTYTAQSNGLVSDSTSAAPNTTLPGAGSKLFVGYPEKIEKLRFTKTTANVGYSYTIKYPTAVDANRVVTAWGTLTVADGTAGFTSTGDITFTPPSDWVAGRLTSGSGSNQTSYLYWLDIEPTATGTTQPVGKLTTTNWDSCGDGAGGPAATGAATLAAYGLLASWARYRSRLPYNAYGIWRLSLNPLDAAARSWAADYLGRIKAANPAYGAFFLDNSQSSPQPSGAISYMMEALGGFNRAYGTLVNRVWAATGLGMIPNALGGIEPDIQYMLGQAPFQWNESLLRAFADTSTNYNTNLTNLAARAAVATQTSGNSHPIILADCYDNNYPGEDTLTVAASPAPTATSWRANAGFDTIESYAPGTRNAYVRFLTGPLVADGPKQIATYSTATGDFTVATPWSQAPASGDAFLIDMTAADGTIDSSNFPATHALSSNNGPTNGKAQMRRLQEAAAAYYYCAYQSGMRAGMFLDSTATNPLNNHNRFFGYDVGSAVDGQATAAFATGTDPSNSQTYKVFKRDYVNARALYRPLSASSATLGDAGAVTVNLGATYKRLSIQPDGSLAQGPAITTLALRNGEGALLVPTAPVQATGWALAATPTTGPAGQAFVVSANPNGNATGNLVVSYSGGGLTPGTLTFPYSNSSGQQSASLTPPSAGTVTLTPSNTAGLTDPSAATYTATSTGGGGGGGSSAASVVIRFGRRVRGRRWVG